MSSTLKDLTRVIAQAARQAKMTKESIPALVEEVKEKDPYDDLGLLQGIGNPREHATDKLFRGDNLRLMKHLAEDPDVAGKIQMIYIDPPFFSKAEYDAVLPVGNKAIRHRAYEDKWQNGLYEYLRQLTARLILMKELLADDGLIFLHLDWHVVHYARIIMDEVFGEKRFVNEIIWQYKSGGSSKKHFARKHDNILVYSKSGKYKFHPLEEKSYNRQFKPYRFKGVKEYEDELGWYTLVNMKDVWQIDMVGRTSAERTGYATQKPEQLLSRIVECCTDPGDLCADFFCGSGTLPVVAARMGRRFIGCDQESLAVESTAGRLWAEGRSFCLYQEQPLSEELDQGLQPRFTVDVTCDCDPIPGEDKAMIRLRIDSVRERRMHRDMDEKDQNLVKKTAKDDPLALLRSWSCDFDFDGEVHRPDRVFLREKDTMTRDCEQIVSRKEERRILLRFADMMGRVFYKEIRI